MLRQVFAQICFDFFSRLLIVVEPKKVEVSFRSATGASDARGSQRL